MNRMRKNEGFTLIEVIVAVGIIAILSAAVAINVVKYLNDGRIARAASDAQTIGTGIQAFLKDTGRWPVSNDGNIRDTGEISRLVGLPRADAGTATLIADGSGTAPGDDNWDGGGSGGTAAAMEDLLIFNRDADTDPLYVASLTAPVLPGWNGPYIDAIPLDPWGNPYVCNIRYAPGANVGGVTPTEAANHIVVVLSPGADGLFQTSFNDGTALPNDGVAGDDIGYLVAGVTQ